MMFLILCYFLFPSVCGGCLCSGSSSGTASVVLCSGGSSGSASVVFVLDDYLILCYFLFPSVCGGCLCSGGSCGTASVGFVLDDFSNTMLFSVS